MAIKRKIAREKLRRAIASVPLQVVKNVEEIQELNAALHTFNQELLKVLRAAEKLLAARADDLAVRVDLGKQVDNAKRMHAMILAEAEKKING